MGDGGVLASFHRDLVNGPEHLDTVGVTGSIPVSPTVDLSGILRAPSTSKSYGPEPCVEYRVRPDQLGHHGRMYMVSPELRPQRRTVVGGSARRIMCGRSS